MDCLSKLEMIADSSSSTAAFGFQWLKRKEFDARPLCMFLSLRPSVFTGPVALPHALHFLRTLSDGKLTNLKCLSVATSWIDTEIMIILLQRTCFLQELDMSKVSRIKDGVCEVITKFTSHSLKVLYLPDRISFWYPSQSSTMLNSCQELVTLGVDRYVVDAWFIVTFLTA